MDKRIEKAMNGKDKGYTCAQCVVCAFSDLIDIDEKDLFKAAEGFGGGIGGLMEVCGVVSAMTLIVGLLNSSGNLQNNTSKEKTIELTKELALEFKAKNHTFSCRELRGIDTGVPLRNCDDCIKDGINILATRIFKIELEKNL